MNQKQNIIWIVSILFTLLLVVILSLVEYQYNYYNNYLIFTRPFGFLANHGDIYNFHPESYSDTFKYSPVFAWVMGIFSVLNDRTGLVIWNLLNIAILILGIDSYFIKKNEKVISLLLLIPMIAIDVHNDQSNPLMIGSMLIFISSVRDKKLAPAILSIVVCFLIKVYAVFILVFALLYPNRLKYGVLAILAIIVSLFLPLLYIGWDQLIWLNTRWFETVIKTQLNPSCTIMGLVKTWFEITITNGFIEAGGLIIMLLPLVNYKFFGQEYYLKLMAASSLIFLVLFNKMAGFPTYIIAVAGSCIWLFSSEKKNIFKISVILFIFVLGIASQYRLPFNIVDKWIIPSQIWVLPFLIIWIDIQIKLWRLEFNELKYAHHSIN